MNSIILCEYPLSLPRENLDEEDVETFDLIQWDEHEFQSFSFFNLGLFGHTEKYTISEDGQLYKHIINSELFRDESGGVQIRETETGIERQDFTGEIIFHTLFMGEKHDYWFEFKSLFWKGDMKELELDSHDKHSNEKRLEVQKKYTEEVKLMSVASRKQRWWSYLLCFFIFPFKIIFSFMLGLILRFEIWSKR